MTPHLGEFSRLIDLPIKWIERHYITLARAFTKAHQVLVSTMNSFCCGTT